MEPQAHLAHLSLPFETQPKDLKPRRRLSRAKPAPPKPSPTAQNPSSITWSMVFVHGCFEAMGRVLRTRRLQSGRTGSDWLLRWICQCHGSGYPHLCGNHQLARQAAGSRLRQRVRTQQPKVQEVEPKARGSRVALHSTGQANPKCLCQALQPHGQARMPEYAHLFADGQPSAGVSDPMALYCLYSNERPHFANKGVPPRQSLETMGAMIGRMEDWGGHRGMHSLD